MTYVYRASDRGRPRGNLLLPFQVGGDIEANHDEAYAINVLRLSGEVVRIYPDDPLRAACDAKLSE